MKVISKCSICGHRWKRNTDDKTPFCPNCGSDTFYDGKRTTDRGSFNKKVNSATSVLNIEDVRANKSEEGEVIFNFWYIHDGIIISSLRAKIYLASGGDDDKVRFLRKRANHDFREALKYKVPENLKVDVKYLEGANIVDAGSACTHDSLEFMGGYPALFREIIINHSKKNLHFDPHQALMCITGLKKGHDGQLTVDTGKKKWLAASRIAGVVAIVSGLTMVLSYRPYKIDTSFLSGLVMSIAILFFFYFYGLCSTGGKE